MLCGFSSFNSETCPIILKIHVPVHLAHVFLRQWASCFFPFHPHSLEKPRLSPNLWSHSWTRGCSGEAAHGLLFLPSTVHLTRAAVSHCFVAMPLEGWSTSCPSCYCRSAAAIRIAYFRYVCLLNPHSRPCVLSLRHYRSTTYVTLCDADARWPQGRPCCFQLGRMLRSQLRRGISVYLPFLNSCLWLNRISQP